MKNNRMKNNSMKNNGMKNNRMRNNRKTSETRKLKCDLLDNPRKEQPILSLISSS